MRGYLLLFLCSLILLLSCKKDTLKSPVASFLVIDNISVNPTINQGSNSQKITDMWYYVDGEFKGVFPIGSVMPIVASNTAEITLLAGIKNNGISATRTPYQFYKAINYVQPIEAGKTYTYSPKFEYSSNAIFHYTQEFNSQASLFISAGDSSFVWVNNPTKAFGGTGGSIFMSMSDTKPTAKMLQSTPYYLPIGGTTVYLELNYKCNQTFVVGVIGGGTTFEREAITVSASDEWNKIYIQLTSVISTPPTYQLNGYQVYIKATKQVQTPEIYIDNIKLISL